MSLSTCHHQDKELAKTCERENRHTNRLQFKVKRRVRQRGREVVGALSKIRHTRVIGLASKQTNKQQTNKQTYNKQLHPYSLLTDSSKQKCEIVVVVVIVVGRDCHGLLLLLLPFPW
jgi:hypothetical protein